MLLINHTITVMSNLSQGKINVKLIILLYNGII